MIAAAVKKPGDKCAVCTDGDADFIITRANGSEIKLQVWGGFVLSEKNRLRKENIHIAFRAGKSVYCYPHKEVCEKIESGTLPGQNGSIVKSRSWQQLGHYAKSSKYFKGWLHDLLKDYRIS